MFMSVIMGVRVLRLEGLLAHIAVTRFMRGLVDLFKFAGSTIRLIWATRAIFFDASC